MDSNSDSDTDDLEYTIPHITKRLTNTFEPYFKRIFNSSGFIKHMNQRCTGVNDSTSYILLCEAIKRNDNRNAIFLLKYYCKANMGSADPSKDIPLQLAILAGNIEIVTLLLEKGARVNIGFQDQKQPLHIICDKASTPIPDEVTRISIAKLLLKHGADINAIEKTNKDSPLILSVRSKFLELAKFLISNGSDKYYSNILSETAFHVAFSENAGIDMIELLYDENKCNLNQVDDNDHTVFSYAVRNLMNSGFRSFCSLNEPLKAIQFLIKHGVSVNTVLDKKENKILHMICQNHAAQTMKIFLDYNVEVNSKNADGKTPLHFCAESQPLNFIELLIKYGADVNILTNNGHSVIHFAASNKHFRVLESLLKYGLDINAKGKDGNFSPLFFAVWCNRYENVKTLLEWHVNVNERVINNQIALHVAVDQKHVKIIDLLLEYGSDINVLDHYGNTPLTISLYQIVNESLSALEDSTGENEEAIRPSEAVRKKLTKHTAKLFTAGLRVSGQSLSIMNNTHFKSFFEECLSELNLMKETEVMENVNFLDVLQSNESRLLSYVNNDNFSSALNVSEYGKAFPIYCDNLEHKIDLAIMKKNLLESSKESLIQLIQNSDKSWIDFHMPTLIVEHILRYLNIRDLENLSSVYILDN